MSTKNLNLEPFKNKLAEAKANNSVITKSEITELMTQMIPHLPPKVVAAGSKIIFDILGDTLVLGYRIEIRGFGSWSIRYLPPRNAHNPRSGDRVTTIGKYRPHFKAGISLKERVNKLIENDQQEKLTEIKSKIQTEQTELA